MSSGSSITLLRYPRCLLIYSKYRNFTMIGPRTYARNLIVAESVADVPGCVVECGVWRGGMSAGLADVLGAQREYFLFDSFEGLPPATDLDGEAARQWQFQTDSPTYYDNCRASIEDARQAMSVSSASRFHIIMGC